MIKKTIALFALIACLFSVSAQVKDSVYRPTPDILNNLVHTKLDVRFDYAKRYLYGKAWITLHPHYYPTDSLLLDAKGMDIKEVSLVKNGKNIPVKYKYDDRNLRITLDRTYKSSEQYTVYINYVAKPDELKDAKASAAITSAKGLYFINPDGKEDKPVEIWTQGETEASSVWFPTIDKTNQKTTSEIAMTVPAKYVTLSNGRLASQHNNNNGTRTDTWKMELPHAPYLFMMAVGDFKIYKDNYNGKEVSYYLEPAYAPYAKQIFGNTPEMIKFYEKILGIPYAWNKYSQIVCRDYVSGAMENTTATLHGEYVHRNARELLDGDPEDYICHELFHQWFGDLVTCENWTNLTLNESFANYSEYLWFEYKYGKDRAGEQQYNAVNTYLRQADGGNDADLVRFYYEDQEDMFDGISYQKGGRILNMLRNYLGDSAFFNSLHLYLKQNMFKSAEVPQLRMAFEEVTGKDLNWFFNQWYYGKGYPILDITYQYDEAAKKVSVVIKQTQKDKIFKLPFAIDIYEGDKKKREMVMLENREQTFTFDYTSKPDLVNVDGDRLTLMKKTDPKSLQQLIFQYDHAAKYLDRREAIEAALKEQAKNEQALRFLGRAVNDPYYALRVMAINGLKMDSSNVQKEMVPVLEKIAVKDDHSVARAAALRQLARLRNNTYKDMFNKASHAQSYAEAAAGLTGLTVVDLDAAYAEAKRNETDHKGALTNAVAYVYIQKKNESDVAYFRSNLAKANSNATKAAAMFIYFQMLTELNNAGIVNGALDEMKQITIDSKSPGLRRAALQYLDTFITKKKTRVDQAKDDTLKQQLNDQIAHAKMLVSDL